MTPETPASDHVPRAGRAWAPFDLDRPVRVRACPQGNHDARPRLHPAREHACRVIILTCLLARSWFHSKQSDKKFSDSRKVSLHTIIGHCHAVGRYIQYEQWRCPVGLPLALFILDELLFNLLGMLILGRTMLILGRTGRSISLLW